jgi:hypothetical protein
MHAPLLFLFSSPPQPPVCQAKVLHAYMAEPWEPWEGLARGSAGYERLKGERAEALWGLVEQARGGRGRGDGFGELVGGFLRPACFSPPRRQ